MKKKPVGLKRNDDGDWSIDRRRRSTVDVVVGFVRFDRRRALPQLTTTTTPPQSFLLLFIAIGSALSTWHSPFGS